MKTKTIQWMLILAAAGLVAVAGCKKAEKPEPPLSEYYGVKVDWPKLATEFTNPSQDVQTSVRLIQRFFRYQEFPQALAELNKLSGNPSLTEPQKKLINDLIEQTRQVMSQAPPPGR